MHDTAYRIGGLVMDTYLPATSTKILEIGALNVNGTLRDHSPRNAEYIGLDFEAGEGVDIVITGLKDWSVPDEHFDLVMASSVFEHDPTFWKTFLAMCRKVKPGGHIYVSAPSNGAVHRYPRDYWRFYPDSGLALEGLGRAEGVDLTLIESFVAERETDGWNDFCAVFRVGPSSDELNRDFVHAKVRSTNAINWRSSLIVNPVEDPEDVRLLRRSREEGHERRLEGEALREELRVLRATHEEVRVRLTASEVSHVEEVAAWTSRVTELANQIEVLKAEAVLREKQFLQVEAAKTQIDDDKAKFALLAVQVDELADEKAGVEQRLHERFREIAGLTRLIQERDQIIEREKVRVEWLRQVISVLTRGFSTSRRARFGALLPVWFNQRQQKALLRQKGLFNAEDYMAVYPDVGLSGTDPLRHYINHGIPEGRSVGRSGQGN